MCCKWKEQLWGFEVLLGFKSALISMGLRLRSEASASQQLNVVVEPDDMGLCYVCTY